jgi:hypothetical protein
MKTSKTIECTPEPMSSESITIEPTEVDEDLQGAWMYMSRLDEEVRRGLEALVEGSLPSRNKDYQLYERQEVKRAHWLFHRAHSTAHLLKSYIGLWTVELLPKPWRVKPDEGAPPFRYEVHVAMGDPVTHHLYLTPAELTVITMIDPDLGRAIGDELDGPRPTREDT